jgi:uncharacterized protein YybS (DUF2232 family)
MEKLKFGFIISVVFFLIFVELAILYLKDEVSLFAILETSSVALLALVYYFIVSSEVKMALKSVEEVLMRIETRFEDVERRFEKTEMDFDEDVRIMKDEIAKLEGLLKKLVKP